VPVIAATCGVLFGLLPERRAEGEARETRETRETRAARAHQGRPRPGEAAS
jgi:hypothetical protein